MITAIIYFFIGFMYMVLTALQTILLVKKNTWVTFCIGGTDLMLSFVGYLSVMIIVKEQILLFIIYALGNAFGAVLISYLNCRSLSLHKMIMRLRKKFKKRIYG